MRLLSLDYDPIYGDDDCTRSTFDSDISVFDYDVVNWDPAKSLSHYHSVYGEQYQNLPSPTENESVRLLADIDRRRGEFRDFLNAGRILIVITRPPQECYVDTGKKEYSGTGRNRSTTRVVSKADLWRALPVARDQLSLTRASGSRIQISGSNSLATFLKNRKAFFKYDAVMSAWPGADVARVQGTERAVSSYVETEGGGILVLLPAPDLIKSVSEKTGKVLYKPQAIAIQGELIQAVFDLTSAGVISRPAWAEKYSTKAQLEVRESVVKQQARVQSARTKLTNLQKKQEESELKDQLFLGTGRPLELQVKAVFELLGCEVSEPEPGRDDWKVKFPRRNAVVEVKGVAKSAAEKHAAQLEKWVAGEMEEVGTAPKGVLVVNTWRETELADRTEKDFPDQMIPYSRGREHCLVTGLQLFVIQAEVEADPARAEYWRGKILETSGVLEGADDWRAILMQAESGEIDTASDVGDI
ncbi:hypothetical protein [Mycobacterium vicinigordonae]|uniref:Restriction endonuclease n=1 Tax=Mycobacterium vicinigordonae TaxID=1719132 RepID=A0A7D6DZQ0_9MYCO|nr:hypothetical protein [Mycobacterium vicinigordonae]QLL08644.1 hypothetical protein H0P51_06880 [Mycobacterium vicinigordonae]